MPRRNKTTFKIDWKGPDVAAAVQDATKKGINQTMGACVEDAQPNSPVVTGTLRRSIRFDPAEVQGDTVVGEWGSFDVNYALFVEVGARGRHGRNMLRNAADKEYPTLAQRIADNLR